MGDSPPKQENLPHSKYKIMTIIGKLINPTAHPRRSAHRKTSVPHTFEAVSEAVGTLRAYRDAPWQLQRQWVITFIVGVVIVAVVSGLYLNVTARAAIAGREIQNLEVTITNNEHVNADLQIQIASELSNTVLEQRAQALGYQPVQESDIEYMVVPGYFPQQSIDMSQPVAQSSLLTDSPEFSTSLIDWFSQQMQAASLPLPTVK